jgi:hypothetical protein
MTDLDPRICAKILGIRNTFLCEYCWDDTLLFDSRGGRRRGA